MVSWLIAATLLGLLILLAVTWTRLKSQIRQERAEIARLSGELASVQKELAEVKTRGKKSFAASMEALIIVEKDYTISSANKMARRMFGKPAKGTTLMAWTREHRLQELVDRTLQREKMPPLYFDLGERSVKARARFVKENKQVVAVALAIQDVTELQHLSRARRDFVANISHELRTPLASIQLLTETLLNGALNNKDMAFNLVDKIATQTDTLSQLAQELMDLSMIESGKAPLKMSTYPLKPLAEKQADRLLPQARRKELDLNVEIDDDIIVLIDETMIGRVIANLLHNAIKFTEAGRVTISAQRGNHVASNSKEAEEGEWVTVSVTDTGVGIPPYEIDRIFERFYIVDRARNRKKSGTGLGLAIAKHIVEAHGGCICARSDGHSGTTFSFILPVEEELPVDEKEQALERYQSS